MKRKVFFTFLCALLVMLVAVVTTSILFSRKQTASEVQAKKELLPLCEARAVSKPTSEIVEKEGASAGVKVAAPEKTPQAEKDISTSVSPVEPRGTEHVVSSWNAIGVSGKEEMSARTELKENQDKNYQTKLREVHGLGNNLSLAKVQELQRFLNSRVADQKDMDIVQFNSIKNDTLDKLIAQEKLPEGLGQYIVDMYRDRNNDDLWRDYCVQHFSLYYERKWPNGSAGADAEAEAIRSALWDAAEETEKTIAGTALLGLERVSREDTGVDRGRVAQKALNLAMSESCPLQTRITAMQICGVMGQSSILPTAREVAKDEKSIPLRMSAIATIGDIGGPNDVEFLKGIMDTARNTYEHKAVECAIGRIKKRID